MPSRPRGSLLDPKLAAQVSVTRPALALSVAVGLGVTASLVVQAALIADVVDRAMLHRAPLPAVVPQLAGLAAAVAARAALGWLGELSAQRTAATVTSVLRRRLLRHTVALGPRWLAGERTGELSVTATRGIDALHTYFGRYLPQAVLGGLAPFAIVVWVATLDWLSALLLLVLVALVPVAMIYVGRKAADATERQWRRLASLSAHLLEVIQGLATLRAFGRQAHGRREVAEATEGLRRSTLATLRLAFLSALSMELLSGLGVGLVAMVLGLRLLDGSLPFGTALAVLLVAPEVFLPIRRAGAEFHASAEGQAAAARILDVLDQPLPAAGGAAAAPDAASGTVVVRGLSVEHPGRARPAPAGLHLHLAPGEHVALVGPSGSGKSTVLAALLGFVALDPGTVTVAGVDLGTVDLAAWRRQVAWVPQLPHLFRGTLADNLRLGAPGAGEGALARAVEAVGLGRWLGQLPRGLDTVVGDGGLGLSAGERQRLALGRALLTGAPLVLLDEPAAHLDEGTVDELRSSLGPWLDRRTVLVASHGPVGLCRVDRVVAVAVAPAVEPAAGVAVAGGAP